MRDKFEAKLVDLSIIKSIPILAVCRGFQFVNNYFGGSLEKIKNHSNTNHKITFNKRFYFKKNTSLNTNLSQL